MDALFTLWLYSCGALIFTAALARTDWPHWFKIIAAAGWFIAWPLAWVLGTLAKRYPGQR